MPTSPEPRRGLITREIRTQTLTILPDTHVWIMQSDGEKVRIEFEGRSLDVPADAIISVPVPRPSIDELRKLDACFGLSADDFEVVHDDEDHWFRLLRCKVHQRYFLEDTRGDVGVYTRTILVSDDLVDQTPMHIWRKYHGMSGDWLDYLGIAL